jgi:transcription elongation factor GreA
MTTNSFHLTQEGLDDLKKELDELTVIKLPNVIERVKNARENGDLSENSEYHAAREDHALIQGRIEELQELIAKAKVVAKNGKTSVVSIGNKVTVKSGRDVHTYHIVGKYEADPTNKKISDESPLGQALIGKKVGQEVEYVAPVGKIVYQIVQIH